MGTENRWRLSVQRRANSVRQAALLAGGCLLLGCQNHPTEESSDYSPRIVPAVSSRQLVETEIVPTLDTPLASAGNGIWCATFQVAWNRVRDDVIGGPLRISGAQLVANRLNDSPVTEAVLPSRDYFAAAGRLEDGIVETIRQQMAQRFPAVRLPDFDGAVGFVTYGCLDTACTFTTPFMDTTKPIAFSDASGVTHAVSGFGLYEGTDWDLREKQAAQVRILFSQADDVTDNESDGSRLTAFAIDLTADQPEQQVIVAVLPRAEHLQAGLDDLASRINQFAPNEYSEKLQEVDILAIPNVTLDVNHDFAALQGADKTIENPGEFQGLPILRAAQSIRFRLDKSGATVISQSRMYPAAIPRHFVVDRPFLIVMKRRLANEPYFVAWIDNTEFLEAN